MKKIRLAFVGALAALLLSSVSTTFISTPHRVGVIEYATGDPVGSIDGLVIPHQAKDCIVVSNFWQQSEPELPNNVPNATWYNTGSPPTRFMKDTHFRMYFESPEKINRDEGEHGHPYCDSTVFAYTDPSTRTMHLPNPCRYPQTDAYARLACHEMGHMDGWPGYHGD